MTDITIPPLIYLREAGRTAELCIKPYGECIKTYPLTTEQLANLAKAATSMTVARLLDVKV